MHTPPPLSARRCDRRLWRRSRAVGERNLQHHRRQRGEPLEDWSDVTVTIDVEALTLTVVGDTVDVATDLTELPEEEWMRNCPTNASAVALQTFSAADPITLGDATLDTPLVFAAGCQGDEGTTATTGWLSSQADQDAEGSPGTGMFYLEQR